jgi:hypothetical protein
MRHHPQPLGPTEISGRARRRHAARRVDDGTEPGKGVAVEFDRDASRIGNADRAGRADKAVLCDCEAVVG